MPPPGFRGRTGILRAQASLPLCIETNIREASGSLRPSTGVCSHRGPCASAILKQAVSHQVHFPAGLGQLGSVSTGRLFLRGVAAVAAVSSAAPLR